MPHRVNSDMGIQDAEPAETAPFARRPWRRVSREDLGPANGVPTMLSGKERRLYYWLARHWAAGLGAVVDLGCFAGGSTACLAEGVTQSGRATPVVGFDRFRVSAPVKERVLYKAGISAFEGTELLPLAERLLSPWAGIVSLRKGNIETADWSEGPIEILAIDAAKSVRTADRIAEIFFPHLMPGRSVVVQQDFLHWKVPWIPAQMEYLSDCFRPVAYCPRDTVVFLCTRTPDAADLEAGRVRERRDAELVRGIAAAEARLGAWPVSTALAAQTRAIALNPSARRAKDFGNRP